MLKRFYYFVKIITEQYVGIALYNSPFHKFNYFPRGSADFIDSLTTAAAVAAAVALNYISEARNNLLLIFEKGRSQTKIRFSRLRLFDNDSIRYFSGISR